MSILRTGIRMSVLSSPGRVSYILILGSITTTPGLGGALRLYPLPPGLPPTRDRTDHRCEYNPSEMVTDRFRRARP